MNRVFALVYSLLLATSVAWSADYINKYKIVDKQDYPSQDIPVVSLDVTDYGVDATGNTDCTSKVQAILDAAAGVGTMTHVNNDSKIRGWYGNPTGGVVYFPEGKYLFTGSITIPRGVTIRGDWKKPEKGVATKGTIFVVKPRRGAGSEIESSSFIIMQPTTEVNGITFWYPEQKKESVTKYPPTVLYGQQGYFGNDYCTVQRCTFLNSYTAVKFSSFNGGGCPNVFNVYGTPLSKGVVIDNIADVGRLDGIYFDSSYWEDCGLEGAPVSGEIDSWLYDNAIGIVMRRNDWTYTCNVYVRGYNVGFHAEPSDVSVSMPGNPNGHNYRLRLSECHSGIRISGASNSGLMFADVTTENCEIGLDMPASVMGPVQVQGSAISGLSHAILMGENSSPGLQLQQCTVSGSTAVLNGQFTCVNSTFNGDVYIGPKARTIFVGNTRNKGSFVNESLFECKVDNSPVEMRALPEFKDEWMERKETRPSRSALYVVTDSRFGAVPLSLFDDLATAKDNTSAIQKALDLAASEGGGVVYLPTGHYKLTGSLTIPTGVELKGSGDLMSAPKNNGSVLETVYGEGDENAAAFILMEKGSGLRGVTINYPNQTTPVNVKKYPYAVRGNADVYICNLALRATYQGVDLFTNKCDNHYVDYISGHAFKNVIRVGNGSANGTIANIQCNTITYACGDETKFGCWPNCEQMKDDDISAKVYGQNSEELDFLILGDSDGEVLYNNFLFGCHQGIVFRNEGKGGAQNVRSLGNAVDGAVETFVFESGNYDIDLINSQVVALNHDKENEYIKYGRLSASFVVTGKDFNKTATFFSGNFWGGGDRLIKADGGIVNLYSANLAQSGSVETLQLSNNAKVNFVNVNRRQGDRLFASAGENEKDCSVYASILNCNNANERLFAAWENNLPVGWIFSSTDELLPRTGWKATAFNDVGGYGIARYAIDGNASTRWSTEAEQSAGQWFAIDFGKTETFNTLILDSSASPNDGAKGYYIEVFEPESGWRQVASGAKAPSTMVATFEKVNASKVRVTQTENESGGYWSIHEAYIADIASSAVEDVIDDRYSIEFSNGCILLHGSVFDAETSITVYNLSGQIVKFMKNMDGACSLSDLYPGVYLVEIQNLKIGKKIIKIKI